jgi:hypothetical protein
VNRQLFDDWFATFRENDISKLKLAEDFVHSSPYGVIDGCQVYLDLVKENSEAFFSPGIELLDVIESSDSFAVRYLVNENSVCNLRLCSRWSDFRKLFLLPRWGEAGYV